MPITYSITIKPTETKNHFAITWHNPVISTKDCFTQEATITGEETQRLWQWPQCQFTIGQKLFHFLDGDAHLFQQALDHAHHQGEKLQINLSVCMQTADWPFELVAKDNTFLLATQLHLVRYVSSWGKDKEIPPENRPLKLLFMTCSPLDVLPELDFEREEEAIFRITENLAIDMDVEDSGSLEGLYRRLEEEQYDVLHLSVFADIDPEGTPFIMMEDELGAQHTVFLDELWQKALKKNPPRLLFLSGSRTGEIGDKSDSMAAVLFARLLVEKYNMPAVLGWGRSVRDDQAIVAEKMLFHELSRGKSTLEAVQRARYELIKDFPDSTKPAWPLLRLFSNGMFLNSMVAKEQQWKPKVRIVNHVYLKNSQVKVLKEGFVGRRRLLQNSLRTLKQDNNKVGLLLLGTGGLGKSCLAGKICERFPDSTLIIVHGRFNVITLEQALTDAFIVAQDEKGRRILSLKIEMKDKLPQLCSTSFKEKNYLFLLDDFEQNLEGADKGESGPLLPDTTDLLKVLLHYLPFSGKMTQMMITSRYHFFLSDPNNHMVEDRLEKIWLTSFQESEQRKKAKELPHILNYEDQTRVPELLAAGHGNPRLMEWLDILVGQMKAAELQTLLEAIRDKQEDFVRQHVMRELLNRGGKELEDFLCHFSIYRRPVLLDGVEQVVEKAGLMDWQELLHKGMGLSLVEHDQTRQSYQVTPVLREEWLKKLENVKSCHEAAFTYYKKRCEPLDSIDPLLTEEWVFHALECGEEDVAVKEGGKLLAALKERLAFFEARRVGEWILEKKNKTFSTEHDALLLTLLGSLNTLLGDNQKAIYHYQLALDICISNNGDIHPNVAISLNNLGEAIRCMDNPMQAIKYFEQALSINDNMIRKDIPNIAANLNNLGAAWLTLGNKQKAISYFEQSQSILNSVHGDNHSKVATVFNNIGVSWKELAVYQKAIQCFEKALVIYEKCFGKEHPATATILNNIGTTWDDLMDNQKAMSYYKQALILFKNIYGNTHPRVGISLNNIGRTWAILGDNQKALFYYEQALFIWKIIYGDNHSLVAIGLNNIGLVWKNLGETEKAISYYEQALSIDERLFGENHPNIAGDLNNLGMAWKDMCEVRLSISFLQQAVAIWKKCYGDSHPQVATGFNNLGGIYFSMGDKTKAKPFLLNAYNIRKKFYGEDHPETQNVKKWLDLY